ncbi:nuclear transport factor 2 family protein [Streptomyces sp. NPDC001770]
MPDAIFGHQYLGELGDLVLLLDFVAADRLSVTVLEGEGESGADGRAETVHMTMTEVRAGLYFTFWQDGSGTSVTQLQDFTNGVLRATLARGDGSCAVMAGTLRRIDGDEHVQTGACDRKEVAVRAMRDLLAGDATHLERDWTENFVEHSPGRSGGLPGLRTRAVSAEGAVWEPARIIAESDFVVTHARLTVPGREPAAVVDVFRFEGNRIAEHWDVVQTEVAGDGEAGRLPMV